MAPFARHLRSLSLLHTVVYVTAQHRQMFNGMFGNYHVISGEGLDQLQLECGAKALNSIDPMVEMHEPDCMRVHPHIFGGEGHATGSIVETLLR